MRKEGLSERSMSYGMEKEEVEAAVGKENTFPKNISKQWKYEAFTG